MAMAEKTLDIHKEGMNNAFVNERWKIVGSTFLGTLLILVAALATYQGNLPIALPLGLAGVTSLIIRQLGEWINQLRKK